MFSNVALPNKTPWEQSLLKRMMELSEKHPRYGYRRIVALEPIQGFEIFDVPHHSASDLTV